MDKSRDIQKYPGDMAHGGVPRSAGVTWRAICIGLIFLPFNVYWVIQIEGVWYSGMITLISLFMNTTISLLVIILINLCLRRISPRAPLSQAELLTVFIMLNLGVSIASHDFIQVLFAGISHLFWFATPENEWHQLFAYVPEWLTVNDRSVLNGFYNADSTLYTTRNLLAWMAPFFWWSAFIFALLLTMLCINILVKKQWTEREKLVYPIIQLPLTITKDGGSISLFKNRVLWAGFGIAASVDILNSLSFFFPTVPHLSIKFNDIGHLFTSKPWSAIGWMPFTFYPFHHRTQLFPAAGSLLFHLVFLSIPEGAAGSYRCLWLTERTKFSVSQRTVLRGLDRFCGRPDLGNPQTSEADNSQCFQ